MCQQQLLCSLLLPNCELGLESPVDPPTAEVLIHDSEQQLPAMPQPHWGEGPTPLLMQLQVMVSYGHDSRHADDAQRKLSRQQVLPLGSGVQGR